MASITDLLYELTEWLRTTPLVETALWLDASPVSQWLQTHFWAIPIMQITHILTLAMTFGAVLMIHLRILGVTGLNQTVPQVMSRFGRWIWWGFVVLIISGIGMVVGEPPRELVNPVFWTKMVGVIALILITVAYMAILRRNMTRWDVLPGGRIAIRTSAVLIILLWCLIMMGGRWIAYAPV